MKSFIEKITRQITGTLHCFDRVIFKGHLPTIRYPEGLDKFISRRGLKIKDFAQFVQTQSDRLILHAKPMAARYQRPYPYLPRHIRKDEEARRIARERNITRGLICVFSELETCPSFKIAYAIGRPRIVAAYRKCLCIYYYFLHPELGLTRSEASE